jgi:hypothetical protein
MFAAKTQAEPLTISTLHKMGQDNLSLTKLINYETVAVPDMFGIKNQDNSFVSFSEALNEENFGDLQKTEPVDRNSKRVGLLAYKIGCTHFWDRWGRTLPCTVL